MKLPGVNVVDSVEQFKRRGGEPAKELVKLLEMETKCDPEKGETDHGRPLVRKIGKKLSSKNKELAAEVFYTFTDDDVIWLKFRWWLS